MLEVSLDVSVEVSVEDFVDVLVEVGDEDTDDVNEDVKLEVALVVNEVLGLDRSNKDKTEVSVHSDKLSMNKLQKQASNNNMKTVCNMYLVDGLVVEVVL